jgi:hypothetical protein
VLDDRALLLLGELPVEQGDDLAPDVPAPRVFLRGGQDLARKVPIRLSGREQRPEQVVRRLEIHHLRPAGRAVREVRIDPLPILGGDLAVEVRDQFVFDVVTSHRGTPRGGRA